MSAAEDYMRAYRVKFVDVRVNPPGGKRKSGAYVQRCERKGCDELGICKAPKPFAARTVQVPGQKVVTEDNHFFCQRHAAEYNETYDFFDGMTEDEITAFQASASHGHKPTWRFGGGAGEKFEEAGDDVESGGGRAAAVLGAAGGGGRDRRDDAMDQCGQRGAGESGGAGMRGGVCARQEGQSCDGIFA